MKSLVVDEKDRYQIAGRGIVYIVPRDTQVQPRDVIEINGIKYFVRAIETFQKSQGTPMGLLVREIKEHNWVVETIDSGHLGINNFWTCSECGAAGGPATMTKSPRWFPFYADGSGLKLSWCCRESDRLIQKHLNQ